MTITEYNEKSSFPFEVDYLDYNGELRTIRCNSYEILDLIRKGMDIICIDLSSGIYDLLERVPVQAR